MNRQDCWLISKSLDQDGYYIASYKGKAVRAHKKMYTLLKGEIPKGMVTDHLCRNRNCCNPNHIEIVTSHENSRRGLLGAKNRDKTHCPQGHLFTPENTYIEKSKSKGSSRHCKICQYERNKKLGDYRRDWQLNNKDKVHEYYIKALMKKGDIL